MASKTSRTTTFNEQEKLLLAEFDRDSPEGYDRKGNVGTKGKDKRGNFD